MKERVTFSRYFLTRNHRMRYAICNEMYGDWPFAKVCEHAAKLGYRGLELAPFTLGERPAEVTAATRRTLRETAEQFGLELIGLHWLLARTSGLHLTSPEPAIRHRTAAYLAELADLAGDLGARVMVFGSPHQRNLLPGVSPAAAEDHALDVLQQVAPNLEAREIVLALEPLGPEEGDFLLTAEAAIRLAERVGSPAVRLHLDVKAMSTEETSIPEIIRNSREWLVHFHANDPNRLGPGMGPVDFHPIFAALREIDYAGWVSVEVFDYEPGVDRLAGDSLRYMQQVEAELGRD